jgi:phosphate/phosphite/phosphonate ABC transporter binding protein
MPFSRLALPFLVLGLFLSADAYGQEIRLGVLPRLSAAELQAMYGPLAAHLGQRLGRKVTVVVPKNFAAFEDALKKGEYELAFANPFVYVTARKDLDLTPLALAAERKGGERFRGVFIVRKDSGLQTLADLKGKPVIFVDEDSLAGYLAQALALKKAGIDPIDGVVRLPFGNKHDNVAMAVFNRAAAAGGIREDDLEKMAGKVDLAQLTVLARTDDFPNWPIFATPKLDPAVRDQVKAALLALAEGSPELESAKLKRFAPVNDKDYDVVRDAARSVGRF